MRVSQRKINNVGQVTLHLRQTWIQIPRAETTRLRTVLGHWQIDEERLQIEGEPTEAVGTVP